MRAGKYTRQKGDEAKTASAIMRVSRQNDKASSKTKKSVKAELQGFRVEV